MSYKKVVVVGAGPIGLMAAIEARQNFVKDVTVIEKRSKYTRNNVPFVATPVIKHLQKVGVASQVFPKPTEALAPLSRMEDALYKMAAASA